MSRHKQEKNHNFRAQINSKAANTTDKLITLPNFSFPYKGKIVIIEIMIHIFPSPTEVSKAEVLKIVLKRRMFATSLSVHEFSVSQMCVATSSFGVNRGPSLQLHCVRNNLRPRSRVEKAITFSISTQSFYCTDPCVLFEGFDLIQACSTGLNPRSHENPKTSEPNRLLSKNRWQI